MGEQPERLTPGQVRLAFWLALGLSLCSAGSVVLAVLSPSPWMGLLMAFAFGVQAPYQWLRYFRRRP
ncbi:hypothetical protein [Amycolatopsis thermophila]|uniref:Lipoprotein n=1 Tax=Amycolatopsis thermophila TaxID=206084 RepID=A0ABU0ETF1_9PSEU|nr:hypothetical protein [Amycolatopsis thermophila]MDQ0378584.1 hypothetical protein [Amycolatopsis thermophila]